MAHKNIVLIPKVYKCDLAKQRTRKVDGQLHLRLEVLGLRESMVCSKLRATRLEKKGQHFTVSLKVIKSRCPVSEAMDKKNLFLNWRRVSPGVLFGPSTY